MSRSNQHLYQAGLPLWKRRFTWVGLLFCSRWVIAQSPQATPAASPARPTITAPAHIPPAGYLQFEQGFNQANASPAGTARQLALSQTTKIALTTRFMVQFITQPYTYNFVAGSPPYNLNAPGDLDIGVQGIVHKSAGAIPAVALGFIRRVRAGSAPSLDFGAYSQSAILLLSGDIGKFHYDSNISFNELNNGPIRRPQFEQSLAISHGLLPTLTAGRLGGVAELSHFTQPFVMSSSFGMPVGRANTVGLLFAAVYSVRPNLVLDAAFDHGLTSTSTQWQGSLGFTYLLPHRLWSDRKSIPTRLTPHQSRTSR